MFNTHTDSPAPTQNEHPVLSSLAHETGIQSFEYVTSSICVRTEMIDGEPWFVAKDVCAAIGIGWRGDTLSAIPEAWKGVRSFRTPSSGDRGGGEQQLVVISEAGMYKLAFRSNKPLADSFTNWVAGELLPSLRKKGQYDLEQGGGTSAPLALPMKRRLLPRDRDGWQSWADRVTPYIGREELALVVSLSGRSEAHVRKVLRGTTMSCTIMELLTRASAESKRLGKQIRPLRRAVRPTQYIRRMNDLFESEMIGGAAL